MPEFKSSTSRLARLFRSSRDQWKERAAVKQKKLRALEIKVRDLSESRARWKDRAVQLEQEINELKAQIQTEAPKKGVSTESR
jgi:predicted  nucleic acid-binding Zn-ribbon protein